MQCGIARPLSFWPYPKIKSSKLENYLLSGVFLVLFFHLFSHSRKAAPSKMKENTLKIRRPGIKKF